MKYDIFTERVKKLEEVFRQEYGITSDVVKGGFPRNI